MRVGTSFSEDNPFSVPFDEKDLLKEMDNHLAFSIPVPSVRKTHSIINATIERSITGKYLNKFHWELSKKTNDNFPDINGPPSFVLFVNRKNN